MVELYTVLHVYEYHATLPSYESYPIDLFGQQLQFEFKAVPGASFSMFTMFSGFNLNLVYFLSSENLLRMWY